MIDHGAFGIEICPNDPGKYFDTGVEAQDLAIVDLLPKTSLLSTLRKELKALMASGCGMIYFQGGYGIGKTVSAKAATVEAVIKYGSSLYRNQSEIVNYLRASYADDRGQAEYLRRLERFKNVRWLVVDEVGRDRNTDFGIESMNEIINARYQGALRGQTMTVLVSNKMPEEVFDAYIVDRIRDTKFKVIKLAGKSLRAGKGVTK
jgi:DNA replication protein DnaC